MPRSTDPRPRRASRRTFLVQALVLPAASAGLSALACSGAPQGVPPAPPPPASPDPAPSPPPEPERNPDLVALRSFHLAEGIEPALVFRGQGR
jgi:hypothetical protein